MNKQIASKIFIALTSLVLGASIVAVITYILQPAPQTITESSSPETNEITSPETVTEQKNNSQETLNKSSLHACSQSESAPLNIVCYTTELNDSLWTIAERFLGSGSRWRELDANPPNRETYTNPSKQLWVGTEVGIHGSSLLPDEFRNNSGTYEAFNVIASPYNDDIFLVVKNVINDSKTVFINGVEYDDGSVKTDDGYRVPNIYSSITNIGFQENGDVFFIGRYTPNGRTQDFCDLFVDQIQYGFWCGDDVQNPIFSPSGEDFILRTDGQHPDDRDRSGRVHIFGSYPQIPAEGWFYAADIDSITWIDDNSYAHRRYDLKDWWIEIRYMDQVNTHERIGPFDETVEIVSAENGVINYSVEQQDGTETLESYKKLR